MIRSIAPLVLLIPFGCRDIDVMPLLVLKSQPQATMQLIPSSFAHLSLLESDSICLTREENCTFANLTSSELLNDGRLVVGDRSGVLSTVSHSGGSTLLHLGSTGVGPGEYQRALGATEMDGRVGVVAGAPLRVLWYSSTGEFLDQYPIQGGIGDVRVAEGVVFIRTPGDTVVRAASISSGAITDSIPIPLRFTNEVPGQGWIEARPLFAPSVLWAALDDSTLVFADGSTGSVSFVGSDGSLREVVNIAAERVPVRRADARRARQRMLAALPSAALRSAASNIGYSDFYPVIGDMEVLDERLVALKRGSPPKDEVEDWFVISRSGEAIGDLKLEVGQRPVGVRCGEVWVAGVFGTEVGVKKLGLRSAIAPGGSADVPGRCPSNS